MPPERAGKSTAAPNRWSGGRAFLYSLPVWATWSLLEAGKESRQAGERAGERDLGALQFVLASRPARVLAWAP